MWRVKTWHDSCRGDDFSWQCHLNIEWRILNFSHQKLHNWLSNGDECSVPTLLHGFISLYFRDFFWDFVLNEKWILGEYGYGIFIFIFYLKILLSNPCPTDNLWYPYRYYLCGYYLHGFNPYELLSMNIHGFIYLIGKIKRNSN